MRLPLHATATLVLFALSLLAPPVTAQSADVGVIHLFNGRDLTNFYTWLVGDKRADPDKVFTVLPDVDGAPAIRISGQKFGGITTEKEYESYRLVVEFKWGTKTWAPRVDRARDSGVLVHCPGAGWRHARRPQRPVDALDRGADHRGRRRRLPAGAGIRARRHAPDAGDDRHAHTRSGRRVRVRPEGHATRLPQRRPHQLVRPRPRLGRSPRLPRRARGREAGWRVESPRSGRRTRHDHQHPQRRRRQRGDGPELHAGQDHHPVRGRRDSSCAAWTSTRPGSDASPRGFRPGGTPGPTS